MEEKTYTLNISQTGKYQYEVTIPETGATKTAATLDSALNITLHDILQHLTARFLMLVFADQHIDSGGGSADRQKPPQSILEHQVASEVARLGIALQAKRSEYHLVFELSRSLTREQSRWLDEQAGKLFDSYYLKDELEIEFDALWEEA